MKRSFFTFATAGLIVLAGFSIVQAQNPRGGRDRGHRLDRLTEGLNLTPDQQAKVQPIIDQAQPKIAEIHREAMQKIQELTASTVSQIRPLLTPEQQTKLDENAHHGRMKGRKGPQDTTED